MKTRTELNIMAIGSLFAWIFLVLLISEIHNVKYDVISQNTLLIATSKSPIEYQNAANLICEGDCAVDINALFQFIPRMGGIVQFAPKSTVEIGASLYLPNALRLTSLIIQDAYIVMLPECETAFVIE